MLAPYRRASKRNGKVLHRTMGANILVVLYSRSAIIWVDAMVVVACHKGEGANRCAVLFLVGGQAG